MGDKRGNKMKARRKNKSSSGGGETRKREKKDGGDNHHKKRGGKNNLGRPGACSREMKGNACLRKVKKIRQELGSICRNCDFGRKCL